MFPFNSTTKKMTVVIELEPGKLVRVFTKGASENIIEDCDRVIENSNGEVKEFNDTMKAHVKETVIRNMAQNALRTIAMGYKDVTYEEYRDMQHRMELQEGLDADEEEFKSSDDFNADVIEQEEQLDKNLILVAVFGIRDILRPEIKGAVEKCHLAQVNVRMVTGDNQDTAMAIAREIGIIPQINDHEANDKYSSRFRCMTGADFRKHFGGIRIDQQGGEQKEVINDIHAFREIVKELKVLARSTPMDKYILTLGLR